MSRKTSTSLTLFWDPPSNESQNGIIRQYVIRIIEDETSTTTTYMTNSSQLTVNDLHPYYTYKCSVAAETVGVGPYTSVLTVQLDEDSESYFVIFSFINYVLWMSLLPHRSFCSPSKSYWFVPIINFNQSLMESTTC